VHSFKAFLLIGVLFLVCLFVCFVYICLCSMIDASRVNAIREALESLNFKTFRATTWWLKASVSMCICPNNYLITHCIACINFDGFL
jgi:hypothetical protein